MRHINTLITLISCLIVFMCNSEIKASTEGTKIVGGDLSLVPAYVAAGDSWLKADGTPITTTAQMLAYVKSLGWNSVRVRLFVDPTQDTDPAVCQDIAYVKTLGAAIKSAGLNFLLDIHYSDTWADPDSQKRPNGWGTTNIALGDQVYSYTKEVLNTLKDASAIPDFVQIGNEINGGMLWSNDDGSAPAEENYATYGYCPYWTTRDTYTASWERLCRFLHAGSKAVRELCPDAKIIIHNAMEGNSSSGCYSDGNLSNFYTYINQSTDYPVYYDIIGLSYYPAWHGTLDYLGETISALQTALPTKEIQIVETGWYHSNYPGDHKFSYSTLGWDVSALGQYNYLKNLTSKINSSDYSHVTGLYYWQPEECGNGHSSSESTKTVMNNWDNRGLWVNSTGASHALQSSEMTTDVSSSFSNLDFESGNTGWTFSSDKGWSTNEIKSDSWASTASYVSNAWEGSGVSEGYILSQKAKNMPAGKYRVTAVVHTTNGGIYLKANDDKTEAGTVSSWGDAKSVSVETTLGSAGDLTIGIYSATQTTTGLSVYSDNFTVSKVEGGTVYPINALSDFSGTYTDDFTSKQTIADESYIGTSDYLTGWWGAFSDTYKLGDKEQYHFNFINHNAGTDNVWNNWVLCAVNGTGHSTTDRSDYAEYFVLRNDNYELKAGTVVNGLTNDGSSYSITGDESNFIADMNGATVDMYVTYTKGTSIAVNSTITATDGDVYTYTYTYDASAVTADNVYLFLTVDHSYIDLKKAELVQEVEQTIDGVTYTLNLVDGTASVTGYTSDLPVDLVIPSTITYNEKSYSVTSIADEAFKGKTSLNSIRTGNSITSIGASAFSGCTGLNYVCLGTGVTSIGNTAFNGCTYLNVLVLNSSSTITYGTDPYAGIGTDQLAKIRLYLSETLYGTGDNYLYKTYEDYGFKYDNICKTDIKNGIIYGLWPDMSASVAGYTDELPAQVLIQSALYYNTEIYVPCTQYFMDHIEQYAFAKASVLTNVTVCNLTNEIGQCAFRNCTNLTQVTFGEDMDIFYDNVFANDSKLTSLTLYKDGAPSQWGLDGTSPVNGLTELTLNSPYSGASTYFNDSFSTYKTLTIKDLVLDEKETSALPSTKLIVDAAPDYSVQNVTVNRSLAADHYYTLTLPWDLTQAEVTALGFTPYYLHGNSWIDSNNKLHIWFEKAYSMEGGVPYLIKTGTTALSSIDLGLRFTNEYKDLKGDASTEGASNVTFQGNYLRITIPQGAFFISDNLLYQAADETNHLSAYRGYLTNAFKSNGNAKQINGMIYELDGDMPTGAVSLDAETLTPISNGAYYDVFGRKLNAMPKTAGIYIHDGKKVVIK